MVRGLAKPEKESISPLLSREKGVILNAGHDWEPFASKTHAIKAELCVLVLLSFVGAKSVGASIIEAFS